MKNILLILSSSLVLFACGSTIEIKEEVSRKNYVNPDIGKPIYNVIGASPRPTITPLKGGGKQYVVETRTPSMPEATPSCHSSSIYIGKGMPEVSMMDCTPNLGMDGTISRNIYSVDVKGIIYAYAQDFEFIEHKRYVQPPRMTQETIDWEARHREALGR